MIDNPQISQIQKYFDFYIKNVRPLVEKICTQEMYGYHGLHTHTDAVVFRGIDYSLSLNQDPNPVVFACAFHDMARTNDGFNLNHGPDAVPMAKTILNQFQNIIDKNTQKAILYAIINHTTGTLAPDYISACLWDADRTRLSWQYGFDANFYNTIRGKQIASQQYDNYLKFQQKCIKDHVWDKSY